MDQKIADITAHLRANAFPNVLAISAGVVFPILHELGWDPFEPSDVAPEYDETGNGGQVCFALCHPPGEPQVFIEVRGLGEAWESVEKVLDRAFVRGLNLVVLTDGRTWGFYLPLGPAIDHEEPCISELDLFEESSTEAANTFDRYLAYGRVVSGAAFEAADSDRDRRRRDRARVAIPEVWCELLRTRDGRLASALQAAVKQKVGLEPGPDDIGAFLEGRGADPDDPGPPIPEPGPVLGPARPKREKGSASVRAPRGASRRVAVPGPSNRYVVRGREFPCNSGIEAYVAVFRIFAESDPSFCERFARDPASRGTRRRYLARTPEELYLNPERQRRDYATYESLPGGWVVLTHLSNRNKRKILAAAARVAGLKLDEDIVVPF